MDSAGAASMSGGLCTGALAEPIIGLLASFGEGDAGSAAATLRETSAAVDEVQLAGRSNVDRMYDAFRGRAGDAALDAALRGQTTAATASERGRAMADIVERADAEIGGGQREIEEILRSFTAEAEGLTAGGVTPAALTALVGSAIDHVGRALRVAERVRAELEGETAAMNELADRTPAPAVVSPAATGFGDAAVVPAASAPLDAGVHRAGTTLAAAGDAIADGGSALGSGLSSVGGLMMTPAAVASPRTPPAQTTNPPNTTTAPKAIDRGHDSHLARPQSGGVKVTLPDGSTVVAPNVRAADAVRSALSAIGTPYVWGGEAPGVGMDCSGLTQWAYGQAGVSLPRLAQEQGYGHQRVGPGDLMPGDLAVWDGHVAMVVGNGELVEAGEPVPIGPIRTENSGMRFLGFYRPTA
ncbi:C40 family peptidase [Nocardia seriolae]|uniref:C40 family peptidase n=2 Tax=Nocardia seriolae TaxID=37332 RepID=UPI00090A2CDE|nr:C40 family peptidase [Nocardia seriolae]WKY51548.1 C40 family peptidase [Nocardia seriolae]BAW04472.1 conserved hypothetical protein [Nocardia seriolae]